MPCESACLGGDGSACAIFGQAVEGMADAPVRLPQDLPRGRRTLERGCGLGNLASCRLLAAYDYDVGPPAAACDAWERLCANGERRACAFFSLCLLYEPGFRRDPERAVRLCHDGCDHDERVACRALGFVFTNGRFAPQDLNRAHAYFVKSCDLDDQPACVEVAQALEKGVVVPRDLTRAKALYRTACARGIHPDPCEALRRLGEHVPSTLASYGDVSEHVYVSQACAYEWRIPANWEFVAPELLGYPLEPSAEIVAARVRGPDAAQSMTIAVTDVVQTTPGEQPASYAHVLAMLEDFGTEDLRRAGITKIGAGRLEFFGANAVRVDGSAGEPPKRYVTQTLFHRGRLRFEVRCVAPTYQPGLPCRDAFGALVFHEWPDPGQASDVPRVLHLRDTRFGIAYDAPDDSWTAVGPRSGHRGTQFV
jgi:TPR repeat protein